MRISTIAAMLAFGLTSGHWMSAATSQTATPAPPQAATSEPEPRSVTGDRRLDAVVFGLASVSVDAEAAIIRINSLEDRINALEKRLRELEARQPR